METPAPPVVHVPPEVLPLRLGRVPLVVDLPLGSTAQSVEATIDGQPWPVPQPVLRVRGERLELIAELDLEALPDGVHELLVRVGDALGRQQVEVRRPPCAVTVQVRSADGLPVSARVAVHAAHGPVRLLEGIAPALDRSGREAALNVVFPGDDGKGAVLWLPEGRYTLTAARGLRDGVAQHVVVCPAGAHTVDAELVLGPGLEDTETSLVDLHVHTAHSVDTWIPDARRLRSLSASGLQVAVLSDHNVVRPAMAEGPPTLVVGVEHSHQPAQVQVAHINAFPVAPGTVLPASAGRTLASTLGALARLPGVRLVQLDHPRGVDLRHDPNRRPVRAAPYRSGTTLLERSLGYAVWSHPGLDRHQRLDGPANRWMLSEDVETGANGLSFDVVEVLNRASLARYQEVRADWFTLLDHGVFRPATGNSDSHAATIELPGMPANVVPIAASEASVDAVAAALVRGRHAVTNGPIPEVSVQSTSGAWAGMGELASVSERALVRVRIRAAPWVPVQELRLVVNGRVQHRIQVDVGGDPAGPTVEVTEEFEVEVEHDGWVLVEAGWPLDADPAALDALPDAWRMAAPGHVPLGFTNPVRLDADGDGRWRPEGALPDALLERLRLR